VVVVVGTALPPPLTDGDVDCLPRQRRNNQWLMSHWFGAAMDASAGGVAAVAVVVAAAVVVAVAVAAAGDVKGASGDGGVDGGDCRRRLSCR